jgi:hypothetical protein
MKGVTMAVCDTCGNDYDKAFTITMGERQGTFDSFGATEITDRV